MTINSKVSPGQLEMFMQGSTNPSLEVPINQQPSVEPAPLSDGPSVDLFERAVHLDGALAALGRASQRTGFQIAGSSDSPSRPAIEGRYEDATDRVVHGAGQAKERLIKEAKLHFAKASGMYALIGAGYGEDEVKDSTRQDFNDFLKTYADAANRPARDAARRTHKNTQRAIARDRRA